MQGAYVKISVSLPDEIYGFLLEKSKAGETPVSRLISQAVKMMRERESKRRARK